ncbi:MAG: OmpA family protein [Methylohalobius sp.]
MPKYLVLIGATVFLGGCIVNPYTGEPQPSKTTRGGVTDKPGTSAAIGTGVSALAGMATGAYMDRQEAILRQKLADSGVQLVREGQNLRLIMPSNITFARGSSEITSQFHSILNSVAAVLNEHRETLVEVTGHTDATGHPEYNQRLSENRARSVARYLAAQGVDPARLLDRGMGQSKPIAPNDTPAGRAQNRRVEIRIHPRPMPENSIYHR